MTLIIFTDLDGTLLNQEDYDYTPALAMLAQLKQKGIPVIPVTSKTRAEVEGLRQEIGLEDPFIVENGSAVFIPKDEYRFVVSQENQEGDYYLELLGCTYAKAREGLKIVAEDLGESLRGFGDLSAIEIQSLTGLSLEEVKLAKTREFTEPFVTPSHIPMEKIEQTAAKYNFRVLVGDRFSHLIGKSAGKGRAVRWLMENYKSATAKKVVTVGLGNSPNDLEMLETVDIPIVIVSSKGVHPGLTEKGWQIAPSPGSQGWAEAVADICELV
ncbi:HAD-IIB family hydrolase [Pleurocapsales cyanobacterium LEGE 06147]|nr:HAD-IIB family hydrolase [Pleurocapsales cyanobacterium LEGE 06147]